jgi:hypothetical protein
MEFHRLFLKLICVGLLLNPEKLNMMMFFYSNTVIVRTSSYLTFLGLKEGQHRLISEKGGGIPFLLFCDNDQYINNVLSFLLKNITGKTLII